MMHYSLSVVKNLSAIGYNERLKTYRALKSTIAKHGLKHFKHGWREAAEEISKNPLVERVVVTRVREENEGTWRNGRKS